MFSLSTRNGKSMSRKNRSGLVFNTTLSSPTSRETLRTDFYTEKKRGRFRTDFQTESKERIKESLQASQGERTSDINNSKHTNEGHFSIYTVCCNHFTVENICFFHCLLSILENFVHEKLKLKDPEA